MSPIPSEPALSCDAPRRRGARCAGAWLLGALLTFTPLYASAAEIVHVVGKGQTLGRIAKRYRVSVDALREANGLRVGERIHPGLSLVVPVAMGGPRPPQTPQSGDSPKGLGPSKKGAVVAASMKGKGQDRGRSGVAPPSPTVRPSRRGFVRLVRGTEKLEVQTLTRHGHLAPAALEGFSKMLRFYPTGARLPIDPRLAALVGQVSDHFGGRTLHVVSGFRPYSPVQYTAHSNHNVGHAMDFSVEGVPNTLVRDYCRTFRNAGVGYYPNSTFVHLDVRAGKAYWIDYSRPGEAPHYDGPGGQGSPDEAAGDVDSRVDPTDSGPMGAVPPSPAPEAEPGSPGTH
jgi:uncharacterized protein YcbK (DUF882 family)